MAYRDFFPLVIISWILLMFQSPATHLSLFVAPLV